jgi:two-component system, NtrC family, sensor kinase
LFAESEEIDPLFPSQGDGVGTALIGLSAHSGRVGGFRVRLARRAEDGRYRTLLGVPLLREGMPLGAFVLMRKTVRPFTDEQINLVARFADQAVIAIENARLFESEQQRTRELTEALQQQTATADVFKVISRSTFDLQSILEALTESATRLCGATRGTTRRWLRRLTREVRASTRKLRQV